MRLQLVVNPSAGRGRCRAALPAVERALRTEHDTVVTPTRSLEHGEQLAAEAVADDRVVVAMGGDGIVGRVAGAVAQAGGVLGVVPGGRGNDVARKLGLPSDPIAAARLLPSCVEQATDLGVVRSGGREVAFLGIASVGFDSVVQERVLRTRLPLGGAIYLVATLREVLPWRHATFAVRLDGTPSEHHGWAVAVANSGLYGGGMRLAPDASMTDGLLDVVTTAATSRVRFLRSLPLVFSGRHVERPSVTVTRAACVELAADRPFRVFADGDPVGALPATVFVRPGALRLLVPPTTLAPAG